MKRKPTARASARARPLAKARRARKRPDPVTDPERSPGGIYGSLVCARTTVARFHEVIGPPPGSNRFTWTAGSLEDWMLAVVPQLEEALDEAIDDYQRGELERSFRTVALQLSRLAGLLEETARGMKFDADRKGASAARSARGLEVRDRVRAELDSIRHAAPRRYSSDHRAAEKLAAELAADPARRERLLGRGKGTPSPEALLMRLHRARKKKF